MNIMEDYRKRSLRLDVARKFWRIISKSTQLISIQLKHYKAYTLGHLQIASS